MAGKAKSHVAAKKAAKTTAKKPAAKSVKSTAAKPAKVAKPSKPAAKSKPVGAKAEVHAPATKPAPRPTPSLAPKPAVVAVAERALPAAAMPTAAVPVAVRTITAPKPAPVITPQEIAAANEYLLNRSATRSEEPVYVNGRKLPTEEQLLKMSDADYMNEDQLAFFKYRLQQMEKELLANAGETTEHLRETVIVPDPADRATIEEEHALELRTRDRERKLLKKVQSALVRIDSGEYGYCEETGDPIGIPRLLARPTATLSLEAQQRREMKQKLFGD
jgi:DnaK suppressor protein